MAENFDLLGDPIPEGWGKRGRPPHIPTAKNRSKVIMLLALGWTDTRIANALAITAPTLRRHYFAELKVRDEARDRMDATLMERLWIESMGGNVGAIKEFRRVVERSDLMSATPYAVAERAAQARKAKPVKLGKKEQAKLDARSVPEDSGWTGLVRH